MEYTADADARCIYQRTEAIEGAQTVMISEMIRMNCPECKEKLQKTDNIFTTYYCKKCGKQYSWNEVNL